jgi:hypothetical protein
MRITDIMKTGVLRKKHEPGKVLPWPPALKTSPEQAAMGKQCEEGSMQ